MRNLAVALVSCLLLAIALTPAAAWDISYEGDSMPNDAGLSSAAWTTCYGFDPSLCSTSDGILHICDQSTTNYVEFSREACSIPSGTPLTVEARVKVASILSPTDPTFSGLVLGASTWGKSGTGGCMLLNLWTDRITVPYGSGSTSTIPVDLTQFHTLRFAMDSNNLCTLWIDGKQSFSGQAMGPWQNGVFFGSSSRFDCTSDSYWDYVRYSKQFLPVPEPSSFLALLAGIGGVGGLMWRRRR